ALSRTTDQMELRRVLRFNKTLGFTLPSKYSKQLNLHWKDYVDIQLKNNNTIIIKKAIISKSGRKNAR
ncbi:hypothetical protein LCGC14_1845770, partial [marine sediment metagenome]